MDFSDLLGGALASDVLRDYFKRHPTHTNRQASFAFADAFPDVDPEAVTLIWKWKSPVRSSGIDDEVLNSGIERCLIESGYRSRSGNGGQR